MAWTFPAKTVDGSGQTITPSLPNHAPCVSPVFLPGSESIPIVDYSPQIPMIQQIAPPLYGIWIAAFKTWARDNGKVVQSTSKGYLQAVIYMDYATAAHAATVAEFGDDGQPKGE